MARKKKTNDYPKTVKTVIGSGETKFGVSDDGKHYIGGKVVAKKKVEDLLNGILTKIAPGVCEHQDRVVNYCNILYNMAAATANKGTEKEKEVAYAKGQSDIVSDLRYPKTLGHVNDIAVNVMNVLFPARQMYGSVEVNPDKQQETGAFVQVMNVHAKQFKHYTNFYRIIHDSIAYNMGANEVQWKVVKGVRGKVRPNPNDVSSNTRNAVIKEGVAVRHLDIFNTILDHNVDTENYAMDAEYYCVVDMHTDFDIVRMAERGELMLPKEMRDQLRGYVVENGKTKLGSNSNRFYNGKAGTMFGIKQGANTGLYTCRPDFRTELSKVSNRKENVDECAAFDHNQYLNGTSSLLQEKPNAGNELLTVTIRIDPRDFGLPSGAGGRLAQDAGTLEIWRFKILNGNHIVSAMPEAMSHGLLPCNITRPKTELSKTMSLSIAELLMPFQEASSSLMNIFIKQARSDKNKGVTYHDSRVKLDQLADPSSGSVSVDTSGLDGQHINIPRLVYNVQGHPVSNAPLLADQHMENRMQDIFPTQSVDALANLNRPVTHQSRSVSQQQNLPIFVLARIIHEELVEPTSFMHTQDIINYQKAINVFDGTGKVQTIDPTVFENVELDIAVSDGLRGIDTIAIADRLQSLIQFAFQSRRVQQDVDVVAMTGYLLQMEGAHIDLNAFKYETPFDALGEEEKNVAYGLLQQMLEAQEGGTDETQPQG